MATDVNIESPIPVPISGHVVVDTGSIAIGNALTISNFPPVQPITGSVDIGNLPTVQLVSITNAPLPVSGSVNVLNFPAVLPVTISNFPAIQPVTITGTPLPISGLVNIANFPSVQPISGTVVVSNFSGSADVSDRTGRALGHVVVDAMPPVSIGAISISNFPSTQITDPVDRPARQNGHVTVDNFPATQPISGSVAVSGAVAISNFPAVQPVSFATAARASVMLSWERLAGVVAESALTNFTNGTLNAVALAAGSSYTVSAGKTLRITQINIAVRTTANQVVNTRVRIRQAASVANSSPIIWQAELGTSNTANAAEIEYTQSFSPDGGVEISAGQQITITHLESSAVGTVSVVLVGYEY